MQRVIVLLLIIALPPSVIAADVKRCEGSRLVHGACIELRGELIPYQGWPPFLRITIGEKVYGIGPPDNENVPASIEKTLPDTTRGLFRICPYGTSTLVPYLDNPVPIYCIERVTDGERLVRPDVGASHWVPLEGASR